MKIGIPRALFYWKKPFSMGTPEGHFWENFFHGLGIEVISSPKSNKEIIKKGLKASDPEACFATKVFLGHVLWLDGKVDYIFVPRLKTNDEKLEYCPKFFGIPELTKILTKTKILTETFDARKYQPPENLPLSSSNSGQDDIPIYFKVALVELGKKIGIKKEKIKQAIDFALSEEKKLRKKQEENFFRKIKSEKQKILLVSHPYNLYDDYVNVGIKQKLERLGVETIFIDEVPTNQRPETGGRREEVNWPDFHWEFGKEIMEKIQTILENHLKEISGVVEISSFLCGCDAVLKEFIEKAFKEKGVPFLYLIIDEHTADAGVQTRVEAFVDTLH